MKWWKKVLIGVAVAFALMQVGQCDHDNPPVTADLVAPPEVEAVLRRACYDCHSSETHWPWYSRVAPVSWLVHHDVIEGRRHLDFSKWETLPAAKRSDKLGEIAEEIEEGEMPPGIYTPLHPSGKLSAADQALLVTWARGGGR